MKSINALGAAMLAAATLPLAPAAATVYSKTLSQTVNFSNSFSILNFNKNNESRTITTGVAVNFLQFNPIGSQGQALQLTGVRVTLVRNVTADFELNNGSGNARSGSYQLSLSSNVTNPTLGIDSPATVGSTGPIPFNILKQDQGTITQLPITSSTTNVFNATTFAPYIGTGTASLTSNLSIINALLNITSGGTGNLDVNVNGRIDGEVKVEYFYNDPIPEPGSWAMMIIGFGLTGAAARRRRALA